MNNKRNIYMYMYTHTHTYIFILRKISGISIECIFIYPLFLIKISERRREQCSVEDATEFCDRNILSKTQREKLQLALICIKRRVKIRMCGLHLWQALLWKFDLVREAHIFQPALSVTYKFDALTPSFHISDYLNVTVVDINGHWFIDGT